MTVVADDAEMYLTLKPSLASEAGPTWDGAVWIGEIWVEVVESAIAQHDSTGTTVRCRLEAARDYRRAQLLVRSAARVLGFIEVAVTDGLVDFADLARRVAECVATAGPARHDSSSTAARDPLVTVVICTRDRINLLTAALDSVLAVDYPSFDVVVVDNAAATSLTRDHVRALAHPRVRLVEEPVPGVSRARNAGLLAATGDIVAFADDDVVVDRFWLRALVSGFAKGDAVACVSGIVPAGELRTPAQAYFERRVGWSVSTEARLYELSDPPADIPLFPFAVRCYGTGANFAVDRRVVRNLGFDEVLGAGVPTQGGEDLDFFFRVLLSGRQLVHQPGAIVWHRHRADNDALLTQTRGYGLGLGAWLAKIAGDPVTVRLAVGTVLRRSPAFIRHLRAASEEVTPADDVAAHLPGDIGDSMWKQILRGAWIYRRSLRRAGSPVPLLVPRQSLPAPSPDMCIL